ncbi:MAG: class I SAM-dependent methyltransferase [Gemmataceae bacterium]
MSTGIVTFREQLQLRLRSMSAGPELQLGKVVLGRYANCTLGTRTALQLRWWLTPYEAIASRVPTNGVVLELGCGHGLLSMTLGTQASRRRVLGIDSDDRRIQIARDACLGMPNVEFEVGSPTIALARQARRFVGIVMLGLHQLPPHDQRSFLAQAYEQLLPGGVLLIRVLNSVRCHSLLPKFSRGRRRQTGSTQGNINQNRRVSEWKELLQSQGFGVTIERCGRFPFFDRMLVCLKV